MSAPPPPTSNNSNASTATVRELDPIPLDHVRDKEREDSAVENTQDTTNKNNDTIRVFELTLDGVTVQLSSWGATITRFLVPSKDNDDDDVVLGYASPELYPKSRNPAYLGGIVGRVANRIQHGKLLLPPHSSADTTTAAESSASTSPIQLAINNPPHHLHGGPQGFSHKNWKAQIIQVPQEDPSDTTTATVTPAVQFTLVSPHGDQQYPGTVHVKATYRLERGGPTNNQQQGEQHEQEEQGDSSTTSVRLSLTMDAHLMTPSSSSPGPPLCTPINLAQHSYFNLAGHAHPRGILQHTLHLHGCFGYTPVDDTGIPTRQVVQWDTDDDDDDSTKKKASSSSLTWSSPSKKDNDIMKTVAHRPVTFQQALMEYGILNAKLPPSQVQTALEKRNIQIDPATKLPPFGWDHNYIVRRPSSSNKSSQEPSSSSSSDQDTKKNVDNKTTPQTVPVYPVATLAHAPTGRRLTVSTSAPGIQVYSANFIDEHTVSSPKDNAIYQAWQGLCLETQHFPDSVLVDPEQHPVFARGRCVILDSQNPDYHHYVEYTLQYPKQNTSSSSSKNKAASLQNTTVSANTKADAKEATNTKKPPKVDPVSMPKATTTQKTSSATNKDPSASSEKPASTTKKPSKVDPVSMPKATTTKKTSSASDNNASASSEKPASTTKKSPSTQASAKRKLPVTMSKGSVPSKKKEAIPVAPRPSLFAARRLPLAKKPPSSSLARPGVAAVEEESSMDQKKATIPLQKDSEVIHQQNCRREEMIRETTDNDQRRSIPEESKNKTKQVVQNHPTLPPVGPAPETAKPVPGPVKAASPAAKNIAKPIPAKGKPSPPKTGLPGNAIAKRPSTSPASAKQDAMNPIHQQNRLLQLHAARLQQQPAVASRPTAPIQQGTAPHAPHAAQQKVAAAPQPQKRRVVISREVIKASIPPNAGGTFQLYGRRINLDSLIDTGNTSMYALLRAWVQDDPYRRTPDPRSFLQEPDELEEEIHSSASDQPIFKHLEEAGEEDSKLPPSNTNEIMDAPESYDSVLEQFKSHGKTKRKETRKRLRTEDSAALDRLRKRGVYLQT